MNEATKEITKDFYELNGMVPLILSEKVNKGRPRVVWLKRMAYLENINTYYQFSVASARLFQKTYCENLNKHRGREESLTLESHASAISFYSHAKICLESARSLSQEVTKTERRKKIKELQQHRKEYKLWAIELTKKRNVLAAHPQAVDRKENIIVTGPTGWGTNGKVKFKTIDLENIAMGEEKYEIQPAKDLSDLKRYLEKTIEHLKSIWEIRSF